MKHSIFLCDRQWKIQKILHCSSELPVQTGFCLKDLIKNPDLLNDTDTFSSQETSIITLYFPDIQQEIPVIICTFSEYYLVFLALIQSQQDFIDFTEAYTDSLDWARQNLKPLYADEYFQIEQMNNQLINSQRALMKTNQKLQKLLTEIRQASDAIAFLEHDDLTALYSASAFYRRTEQCLKEHPDQIYDIITLDIERFKLVNEIYGRASGDCMLKSLALFMLGLEHSESGIFARASADTFYILMPEEFHFYWTLHEEVSAYFQSYPLPLHVREKIGVCSTRNSSVSVEEMCDRACLAMDNVSPQDEGRIGFYNHALHEELIMNHKILDSIPDALRRREFQLYLQPKVDMCTGEVIGAEALIRWNHPELGFIPPNQFIPLLEKEGFIYEVDKYIWEEACRILRERRDRGLRDLPISVNVARGDLYEKDLCDVFDSFLLKYGLPGNLLHLEIIERAYVKDTANITYILNILRKNGFFIEMDDFGTGESSLSMLSEMPVDLLKLDRSFLASSMNSSRQLEIIRFIITLAQNLNIEILAEGVETQEQADILTSMGCRYAQGYFYYRPAPAASFLEIP